MFLLYLKVGVQQGQHGEHDSWSDSAPPRLHRLRPCRICQGAGPVFRKRRGRRPPANGGRRVSPLPGSDSTSEC